MKRTRFFEPYKKVGTEWKATMADRWDAKKAGVYFIKEQKSGKIVYVGHSTSQLKKTIYRHFQEWYDKSRPAGDRQRLIYEKEGYEVRFIESTAAQATRLEKYFIDKLQPRDNEARYESWWDKLTAPSAESIATLGKKANLAPFMKRDEYWEEPTSVIDENEEVPF